MFFLGWQQRQPGAVLRLDGLVTGGMICLLLAIQFLKSGKSSWTAIFLVVVACGELIQFVPSNRVEKFGACNARCDTGQ